MAMSGLPGINTGYIWDQYPLPLINEFSEELFSVKEFTKGPVELTAWFRFEKETNGRLPSTSGTDTEYLVCHSACATLL